jgi:transporter family-2 protein
VAEGRRCVNIKGFTLQTGIIPVFLTANVKIEKINEVPGDGMKLSIITGAIVALLTGIAITVQSTITSRVGSQIGDIRTGILTNTLGGIVAGALMLVWVLREGPQIWRVPLAVIGVTSLSGILGVLIITGISFSLQRAGVAAGLASVILGQLALSFLIDSLGLGGGEPIPVSASRIAGILVVSLGVYLLLPKG